MCDVLQKLTDYSLGKKVDKLSRSWIEFFYSSCGQDTGITREKIVCNVLGFKHNKALFGEDAWTKTGRKIEIKSETWYPKVGLRGCGQFTADTKFIYDQISEQNYLYVHGGFTRENKLVFIISVPWNKSKLTEKLQKGSKSNGIKTYAADWGPNFKIEYLAEGYEKLLAKKALKIFEKKLSKKRINVPVR